MSKYNDEDVERLVDVVHRQLGSISAFTVAQQVQANEIHLALAPFRPDPEEEELIEAMVEHMKPLWSQYPMPGPPHAELARTALQTIKEKGYFNDQR